MITVKYEKYVNDYQRKFMEYSFPRWSALEDWMFDGMVLEPRGNMLFAEDDSFLWQFKEEEGAPTFIIHMLSSDDGIIFSDGYFTGGKTFCAKSIREHLDQCIERRDGDYRFAEYSGD